MRRVGASEPSGDEGRERSYLPTGSASVGTAFAALAGLVLLYGLFWGGALLPEDRRVVVLCVGALSFLAYAALIVRRVRRPWAVNCPVLAARPSVPELLLVALGVWALASTAWSVERSASLWYGLAVLCGLLYLRLGRLRVGDTIWRPAHVSLALGLLGLGIGLFSLVGFIFKIPGTVASVDGATNASWPLGYPNALAALLLLTLPASAYLTLATARDLKKTGPRRSAGWPALWGGAVVVQLAVLWFTGSRGGAVALAAGLACWPIIWAGHAMVRFRSASWWKRALALAITAATVAVIVVAIVWLATGGVTREQTSSRHRLQTWKTAVITAEDRPIWGWGADTFGRATYAYRLGPATNYAHNLLLQQWVEQGAVGVALLLLFVGVALVRAVPLFWRAGATRAGPWLLAGALAFLAHNLIDLGWYFPALLYVFLLTLGALGSSETDAG